MLQDAGPRVNFLESTMTYRLRDFLWMNPLIFILSKLGEYPQECIDDVYKVYSAIRVTSMEKEELSLYELRDVAQVWYTQMEI